MNNGFFEFGLAALAAFAFINVIFGVTLEAPPVLRRQGKPDLKELAAGIPIEGAELVTPTLAKKVHVG